MSNKSMTYNRTRRKIKKETERARKQWLLKNKLPEPTDAQKRTERNRRRRDRKRITGLVRELNQREARL